LVASAYANQDEDSFLLWGAPEGIEATELRHRLGDLPASCRLCPSMPQLRNAVDVFHSTAWSTPVGLTCPVIFTCYDLTFLSHPNLHTLDNKIHCLTGCLRARLDDATFVAISQATAEALSQNLGVSAKRTRVIYPAPSPDLRPLERDVAERHVRHRFDLGSGYVLAVGTLEPRKNLERLVSAHAGLGAELRQAHPLVIAGGGGWKNDALLKRCSELDSVHRLGQVGDEDLAALYSAAGAFAYPSLAEGFGLPIVEAMWCGAPVLTSNVSAMPEISGGAAHLVDPFDVDAIQHGLKVLLQNAETRDRLIALGRERAAQFSWTETAKQTWTLYRRVATTS